MTRIHRIASYLMIGTIIFSGSDTDARAAELETGTAAVQALEKSVAGEPIAGFVLALDELYQTNTGAVKDITQYLASNDDSTNDKLAFAQVKNYVNIRNKPSEKSDIIGKLYNNSAATIISEKDGWYQVESGSVKGYIKADFLATGEKAEKLAETLGSKMAEVTTVTLKVRKKPSIDEEVLSLVAQGENLKVVKELDGWTEVYYDGNETGYVSNDFVKLHTIYDKAVSIEEEKAADTSDKGTSGTSGNKSSSASQTSGSSSSSSLGSRIASYAVQFKGNPYVWGGTSLTRGADCSGFTQSVFAHFGISIPRTSRTQARSGTRVSLSNLRPGDLIFYTKGGSINHVALYIGDGKVIGAKSRSEGIRITNYNYRQPYKAVRYTY